MEPKSEHELERRAQHVEAYEYFNGGEKRKKILNDFLSGRTTHLDLDYPLLDDNSEIKKIYNHNLGLGFKESDTVSNEFESAQAALVLQAAAARRLLQKGDKDQLIRAEERLREMNAELFGLPDRKLVLSAKKAALKMLIGKTFTGKAAQIYDELNSGFVYRGQDGEEVSVRPFLMSEELNEIDTSPDLPQLNEKALGMLYEKITAEFSYAHKIIEQYWKENVEPRTEEERVINPNDAKVLFESCISGYFGTPNGINIKVLYEENSTSTNWSSEKNAVVVAGQRKPFKDVDEFFGVFIHEFGVHGRRWMNGKKSDTPELSTGVYTVNNDGDVVDYLSFEEGLAGTMQKAARNKKENWDMASLGLYLVAGLANEGRSDREVYEILTRVRALAKLKKGETDISEKVWEDSKKDTLNHVVRLFRGMPKATNKNQAAVYLKDMAYLSGKVKVIQFLNDMSELSESDWTTKYNQLFMGKIDNSEPTQEALIA
jgi:hypothetical protein